MIFHSFLPLAPKLIICLVVVVNPFGILELPLEASDIGAPGLLFLLAYTARTFRFMVGLRHFLEINAVFLTRASLRRGLSYRLAYIRNRMIFL